MSGAENEAREFIIVKRGGRADEGHHGGAWKIAFADFMTAMMALFLVLWLVNAANEETKKAVASYFNPVKLVDRNRSDKGINNSDGSVEAETKVETNHINAVSGEETLEEMELTEKTEEAMFENPNPVLDAIASEVTANQHTGDVNLNNGEGAGEPSSEFQDPFAPKFWQKEDSASSEQAKADTASGDVGPGVDEEGKFQPADAVAEQADQEQPTALAMSRDPLDGEPVDQKEVAQDPETEQERQEKLEELSREISSEVAEAIREVLGPQALFPDSVSVTAISDGILISVTEQLNVPMFRIGSAVPRPEMVIAMEKIGEVLAQRNGSIQIHGHTDGRKYSGANYDNWRLSSARARATYHMLARGGLDKRRVGQISGFADRKLKMADDPNNGANRRIEILLETKS